MKVLGFWQCHVTVTPRSPAGARCLWSLVQLPTNVGAHLWCLQSGTEEGWSFLQAENNWILRHSTIPLALLLHAFWLICKFNWQAISFGDQSRIMILQSIIIHLKLLHPQDKSRYFHQVKEKDSLYCCTSEVLNTLQLVFGTIFQLAEILKEPQFYILSLLDIYPHPSPKVTNWKHNNNDKVEKYSALKNNSRMNFKCTGMKSVGYSAQSALCYAMLYTVLCRLN